MTKSRIDNHKIRHLQWVHNKYLIKTSIDLKMQRRWKSPNFKHMWRKLLNYLLFMVQTGKIRELESFGERISPSKLLNNFNDSHNTFEGINSSS